MPNGISKLDLRCENENTSPGSEVFILIEVDRFELEREDHVSAESSLATSVIFVESESIFVPNPTNFRSEHQVRTLLVVDTQGVVVQVVVHCVVEACTTVVEPLESLSERNAIVYLVQQIRNVAERITLSSPGEIS